jgi:penicillin G amidase
MRGRALKIIVALLAVLLVVAVVVVAVAGIITVRSPFPETDGRLELDGLQDVVHVYRDEYGVPQIYAMNDHDLYFAQGFVHAQDRFWQMEFWRHIGQGASRKSSAKGAGAGPLHPHGGVEPHGGSGDGVRRDGGAGDDGASRSVQRRGQCLSGVAGDDISINRRILGLVGDPWEIEPWEPLHSVAWSIVMSWDLGGNWGAERTGRRWPAS